MACRSSGAKPPPAMMPARSTVQHSINTQSGRQRMTEMEGSIEGKDFRHSKCSGPLPRDREKEDSFNAASSPLCRRRRCPFVLLPFWALPKHHSPAPPLVTLLLSHLPRRTLPNTCFAAESNYGPEQRRRLLLWRLITMKIREEAAKLMLLLIF